jgi:hypothetical protein
MIAILGTLNNYLDGIKIRRNCSGSVQSNQG